MTGKAQSIARAEAALAYIVQHGAALQQVAAIQERSDLDALASELCPAFIPDSGMWFEDTRFCVCGFTDYMHSDGAIKRAAALYGLSPQ